MKKLLTILFLIMIVPSCGILKPKYVTQVQYDTTTVYKNTNTVLHDSIYVWKDHFIYTKGDTVYNTTVEYKDRWRIKEVHDTLYKDKIKYEYKEVPVEVEKPLSGIQKILITFGKVFILVLLALLGYFGIKKFILKI